MLAPPLRLIVDQTMVFGSQEPLDARMVGVIEEWHSLGPDGAGRRDAHVSALRTGAFEGQAGVGARAEAPNRAELCMGVQWQQRAVRREMFCAYRAT